MKKIISLALVLCLVFALAPAAYADEVRVFDTHEDYLLFVKYNFFSEASDDLFQSNGHLVGCDVKNCQCLPILEAADREYWEKKMEDRLQIWVRSSRDADDMRHDTVVAELERPYNSKKITENEEYLESKEAVAAALAELVDADDLAEQLYRSSDFIRNQVQGKLEYISNERESKLHVEYLVTGDGENPLYGYGLGLVEEGSELGAAEHFIVSSEALAETAAEYDLSVCAGNLIVKLPESCIDNGFTLALSFYENGAVGLLLVDDAGKPIPGAVVSTVLPEGAAKAVTVDAEGSFAEIKDSAVEGSLIAFTASSGNDVFALAK